MLPYLSSAGNVSRMPHVDVPYTPMPPSCLVHNSSDRPCPFPVDEHTSREAVGVLLAPEVSQPYGYPVLQWVYVVCIP